MEHTQDVERLFSWLKAPMVHYREFAPQMEVAEAVATWPAAHRTAVQTGLAADTEPGPHGDAAVRERQARDRRFMPPTAARAIHDSPMPGTEPLPTEGRLSDVPEADATPDVETVDAEPGISGFDEPAPLSRPQSPCPPANADGRGPFAGEQREREREVRPAGQPADRQDRSLGAVFSRLSGAGTSDRLPDPRERARTTPGLGPVFGRPR